MPRATMVDGMPRVAMEDGVTRATMANGAASLGIVMNPNHGTASLGIVVNPTDGTATTEEIKAGATRTRAVIGKVHGKPKLGPRTLTRVTLHGLGKVLGEKGRGLGRKEKGRGVEKGIFKKGFVMIKRVQFR